MSNQSVIFVGRPSDIPKNTFESGLYLTMLSDGCCREGMDSRVLRFSAQMLSNKPHVSHRPFIISFFLADDTLNVFENVRINSGSVNPGYFAFPEFISAKLLSDS